MGELINSEHFKVISTEELVVGLYTHIQFLKQRLDIGKDQKTIDEGE
jgi:hypothetical protein